MMLFMRMLMSRKHCPELHRWVSHLLDERAFRIQRAVQCSVMKTVLPKDQWPTYEEDRQHGRYLQPYLEEVIREREEKESWAKQGPGPGVQLRYRLGGGEVRVVRGLRAAPLHRLLL